MCELRRRSAGQGRARLGWQRARGAPATQKASDAKQLQLRAGERSEDEGGETAETVETEQSGGQEAPSSRQVQEVGARVVRWAAAAAVQRGVVRLAVAVDSARPTPQYDSLRPAQFKPTQGSPLSLSLSLSPPPSLSLCTTPLPPWPSSPKHSTHSAHPRMSYGSIHVYRASLSPSLARPPLSPVLSCSQRWRCHGQRALQVKRARQSEC